MLPTLVSRNDDIRLLVEKGYAVGYDDAKYLIVRDVPYLDDKGELKIGAFVTQLVFVDLDRVTQHNHQVSWSGGIPHGLDGKPIPNLATAAHAITLTAPNADVKVAYQFSNKPRGRDGYASFFEKIESYANQIAAPAEEKFGAKRHTFSARYDDNAVAGDSVFKIHDTLTSLAEIGDLAARMKDDVIAIIGVGGTGSYLLDFMAKTSVREIRCFDMDEFRVHNAFRAPGRLTNSEFGRPKVEVHGGRYETLRNGLVLYHKRVDGSCAADFDGVTFAFVCVDKGESRKEIFDLLMSKGIAFIDVGIGIKRVDPFGSLKGTVRTTYYPAQFAASVLEKGYSELATPTGDLYRIVIQTAELNALNAALAVLRFKQLRGFYLADVAWEHAVFYSHTFKTIGDDGDKP